MIMTIIDFLLIIFFLLFVCKRLPAWPLIEVKLVIGTIPSGRLAVDWRSPLWGFTVSRTNGVLSKLIILYLSSHANNYLLSTFHSNFSYGSVVLNWTSRNNIERCSKNAYAFWPSCFTLEAVVRRCSPK